LRVWICQQSLYRRGHFQGFCKTHLLASACYPGTHVSLRHLRVLLRQQKITWL
jgi:hypothetical protein